jgi:hypothetical protein
MNDLRFALRMLVKNPGFTTVAVLTLALGIGANVAMFSIVDAVLLEGLPFPRAERLVLGRSTWSGQIGWNVSSEDYYDYREQADRFESLSAMTSFAPKTTVTGRGQPERVAFTFVADDLFRTLGVAPAAGRWFAPRGGEGWSRRRRHGERAVRATPVRGRTRGRWEPHHRQRPLQINTVSGSKRSKIGATQRFWHHVYRKRAACHLYNSQAHAVHCDAIAQIGILQHLNLTWPKNHSTI